MGFDCKYEYDSYEFDLLVDFGLAQGMNNFNFLTLNESDSYKMQIILWWNTYVI